MKKLIVLLLLLCAFTAIKAQPKGFYYYSRLGLGVSQFNQLANNNQTGKLALNVGLAGNYQFNKYLGLVVEANLSSKGSKIRGTEPATFPNTAQDYEDIYRLFYAEIPLLVKLSFPVSESFYVKGFTGFSNNFKLIGTYSRNYDDANEQDQLDQEINGINLTEYSYIWGLGFEVKDNTDHLYSIDFRSNTALNSFGNIRNSQNNVISGYNSYYTIGFGYSF
jgi:hypothetical protein